jgi:hypothetical protein
VELVLSHALPGTLAESALTTSAGGVGELQAILPLTLADLMGVRGALWTDYEAHADDSFLLDLVEVDEQILTLCPVGHPGRMDACERLSTSLHMVSIVEDTLSAPESAGSASDTDLDMLRMTRGALWEHFQDTRDTDSLEDVICLDEQILALCVVKDAARASACSNLAASLRLRLRHMKSISNVPTTADGIPPSTSVTASTNMPQSLWERYVETRDLEVLEQVIANGVAALDSLPDGDVNRIGACCNLAVSLREKHKRVDDSGVLHQYIQLLGEAYALSTTGHIFRPRICSDYATSLWKLYNHTGDISLLVEATELEREALSLLPPGHPDRAIICDNLTVFLSRRYNQTGDTSLLIEATELEREALSLQPPGHPDRATSCTNLAVSLSRRYNQTGDTSLLIEATELNREALSLLLPSHPDRATSCINLAVSLSRRYNQTGDTSLLIEATELEREALSLLPPGHPDRATSCVNLAVSLNTRYNQTGDTSLLIEATELNREALSLQPPGHPDRATSCTNLAVSLSRRYNQTGDTSLLIEATELNREALSLLPPGHPDRAMTCDNLAVSLSTRYIQTGDTSLLIEATELNREALSLRPPGHPDRATSCINLAVSLNTRYNQTGDTSLLIKATELHREALSLQPPGHPDRAMSCAGLAGSLASCYDRTDDIRLLNEAINLSEQASRCSSSPTIWRSSELQCCLYLSQHTSSELAIPRALAHLVQWSQSEADDMQAFMTSIGSRLSEFWTLRAAWTDAIPSSLVSVYSNVIDRLPLMAAFVLDTTSRLSALRSFTRLGSQACVVAIMAHDLSRAIELLDHSHGVIWAQALHQRDPQLTGVPPALASELDSLLRSIAVPVVPELPGRHLTTRDFRHEQNSRIQTILGEIRAMHGLDRFMRGSTFETLREVAHDHPVVVLVAVDDESYAVIISSSSQEEPDVMKLEVESKGLVALGGLSKRGFQRASTNNGWRDAWGDSVQDLGTTEDSERVMRPGGHINTLHGVLSQLWRLIVKPVLAHLGLGVRFVMKLMDPFD